ncbi:MAG TPA: PilN domain-containing protein [Solirubrobacterales bacterium]|nr:PilN domain-containing protein [Solirubrobacterales bacterium]
MRPVNLIPADLRRGDNAPLRTGPLPYMLLGALVLALAGVLALVLTENQISDRKAEVTQLRREDAAAQARAQRLAAYTQFQAMSEQRVATVTSLANSRFDWERVMRELSLVLPSDVWLVSLNASAGAGGEGGASSESSGGSSGLRGGISGPALELSGCAAGQDAVAGFVTALKDIDGVTRVGVQSSELASGDAGGGSGGEDCRTRSFIASFSLVVAFDGAPVPVTSGETGTAPVTGEAEGASEGESSEGEEAAPEGEGG